MRPFGCAAKNRTGQRFDRVRSMIRVIKRDQRIGRNAVGLIKRLDDLKESELLGRFLDGKPLRETVDREAGY